MDRVWHPKQKIVKCKGGETEISFNVAGLFEVYRWVLAWGSHAKVLEPMELEKMVTDEIRLMMKVY